MADKWIDRWPVIGTSGKKYTVARDKDGNFGCDCNSWMLQPRERWVNGKRRDCQHILNKRIELMEFSSSNKQDFVFSQQKTRIVKVGD